MALARVAVVKLGEIAVSSDPLVPYSVKVAACWRLATLAISLTETQDLAQRVEALEQALAIAPEPTDRQPRPLMFIGRAE